jgi:predicted PurR-regulated permease PerM
MLGFEKPVARIVWTSALVLLVFWIVAHLGRTLLVFVLAVFFSYLVAPLVLMLQKRAGPRVSRGIATAVVFALLALALVILVGLAGPPLGDQARRLSEQLPQLARDPHLAERIPLPDWLAPVRERVVQTVREYLASGTSFAMPMATRIAQGALLVAANLVFVVLIPILAYLMLADGPANREHYLRWAAGTKYARFWTRLLEDLDSVLGRYMRALVFLSLAAMVAYGIAFTIAGVPFGLVLAVIAGVLEFIPVAGPLAAAVGVLVIAAMSGFDHVLLLAGFFVVYRLFQDYVLSPMLMSGGVKLPPLLVLFGLVAGEELGGIPGIFLSVPVLAVARKVAQRLAEESRRGNEAAAPPHSRERSPP